MPLFNYTPIVKWADAGDWIPLKCRICEAVFTTKNLHYVGYKPVHLGISIRDAYPYQSARACNHGVKNYIPDKGIYKGGVW